VTKKFAKLLLQNGTGAAKKYSPGLLVSQGYDDAKPAQNAVLIPG
jgi:hypothetical protein